MAPHSTKKQPTQEEILSLKTEVLQKINELGIENFHPEDLERLKKDRWWYHRYLNVFQNQKIALSRMLEMLRWRTDDNVNAMAGYQVPKEYIEVQSLVCHNRDIMGRKMMMFVVRNHNSKSYQTNDIIRYVIYWLERLEKEEYPRGITVIFDMNRAKLSNIDFGLLKFLVVAFHKYYPGMVEQVLVYEMPWLLASVWNLVQTWLPTGEFSAIDFVKKSDVGNWISESDRSLEWGGTEIKWFEFTEGNCMNPKWTFDN